MVKTSAVSVLGVFIAFGLLLLVQQRPVATAQAASAQWHLDINAQNAASLSGLQADVAYNPTVVKYTATEKGPFLAQGIGNDAMLLTTIDSSQPGLVKNIIVVRLQPEGVTGSGTIATVHFEQIAPGDPEIQLVDVVLSDNSAQPLPPSMVNGVVSPG